MINGKDYLYLRAWCRLMEYRDERIEEELVAARETGAPSTAIFRNSRGVWRTFGDIEREDTRMLLRRFIERL